MDVRGEHPAVPSYRSAPDDDDVLAELARSARRAPPRTPRPHRGRPRRRRGAPSRRTPGTRRSWRPARSRSRPRRSCRRSSSLTIVPTRPSVVARSARLPAWAMPFSRSRSVRAASMSPSVSCSARLHSIIPAPGPVAELLDEAGADLGSLVSPSLVVVARRRPRRGLRRVSADASTGARPRPPARPRRRRGSATGSSAGASPFGCLLVRCSPSPLPFAAAAAADEVRSSHLLSARRRSRRRSRARSGCTSGSRRRCPG